MGNASVSGENKGLIVERLFPLLKTTRAGSNIEGMQLTEGQDYVLVRWENGCTQKVNVAADSGIAMIKDVLKAIS